MAKSWNSSFGPLAPLVSISLSIVLVLVAVSSSDDEAAEISSWMGDLRVCEGRPKEEKASDDSRRERRRAAQAARGSRADIALMVAFDLLDLPFVKCCDIELWSVRSFAFGRSLEDRRSSTYTLSDAGMGRKHVANK